VNGHQFYGGMCEGLAINGSPRRIWNTATVLETAIEFHLNLTP